ncbi:MAG: S8 family serine peptidase [Gemmatimonadetes bacterium]|nr:S8 family serine peptidase [Gemmatimonadota bacterium]MYG84806.1 S8 family serine peptidase [Gemmatimonadota bacterium]MYJ90866.1 S8 family serine peptidase [Gemmatimonadota bacterium]
MKQCAVILFVLAASPALVADPLDQRAFEPGAVSVVPKIPESLQETLSTGLSGDRLKVWIYLADKGVASGTGYALAVAAAEDRLTPRARRRLAMRGNGPAGLEDIPIHTPYVNRIVESGGLIHQMSRWHNAVSVSGDPKVIQSLAELPFVLRIEAVDRLRRPRPVTPRRPASPETTPSRRRTRTNRVDYGPSFVQLNQLQVPVLHDIGLSGQGVLVALFDSGFSLDHAVFDSLRTRVEARRDFVADHLGMAGFPYDAHGTQVLSVIGGFAPGNLVGPAFGARYLLASTEAVTFENEIEEDWWIAALEWADSLGVDVVSSSLGYIDWYAYEDMDGKSAMISRAASMATDRGIVVVSAMGNLGGQPYEKMSAPADAEKVISVGAVDASGNRWATSSVGPTYDGRIKPDVMAMGQGVYTVQPFSAQAYAHNNGTSFSAPLVAGVAALLLEAYPHWTPQKVQRVLRQTASQAVAPDTLNGYGIVQAADALMTESRGSVRSFTAENGLSGVFLSWTAGLEINLLSYRIERRDYPDGSYEELATVPVNRVGGNGLATNAYSYSDTAVQTGNAYEYRLEPVGRRGLTLTAEPATARVDHTSGPTEGLVAVLYPNAPNPFAGSTDIRFELTATTWVNVTIYDLLGRRMRVLADRMLGPGRYALPWNGRDDDGRAVPSGVYLYRMTAGGIEQRGKMLLLR